jgi:hypothetical protein
MLVFTNKGVGRGTFVSRLPLFYNGLLGQLKSFEFSNVKTTLTGWFFIFFFGVIIILMKNSKRIFSLTANSKKMSLINVIAGVIIGALVIYIVGIVWYYMSLWVPLHRSQEISREVDRYIIEYGYKEEIMKIYPEMEIRNLGD